MTFYEIFYIDASQQVKIRFKAKKILGIFLAFLVFFCQKMKKIGKIQTVL
jgi:hypothetical protein